MMMASHMLAAPLAFAFGAPGLAFAGLLLGAIPILIHFLNRRRYRTHRWAAMQYLLEAMRRNRRRLQFENLLLLTLRCCAVLLAAMALARPLGCSQSAAGHLMGQTTRLHTIIIDNSASMAYQLDRPDGRTSLERAKHLAADLIKRLGASHDAVCVIPAASGQPAPLVPDYDLEAAGQAVARLEQTFVVSDLPSALRQAVKVSSESSEFTGRRVYILSDLSRPAWENSRVSQSLRDLGLELAKKYDIVVIDVGDKQAANATVSDVRMLGSVALTSMPSDFSAKLWANVPVTHSLIWQSGERVLGTSGSMPLGQDVPEQLLPQIGLGAEGPTAITAKLEPADRLPEDDARSLVISVRKRLDVLVAEGDRGAQTMQSPGTFLKLALAPDGGKEESDATRVEVIPEQELSSRPLGGHDAVVLAAPSAASAGDAQQLRRYVEGGGTLLIFMGEGVSADRLNQGLGNEGLLPGKVSAVVTASEGQDPFRFDFRPDAALHPLLRAFRGEQNSGMATTRIFTYARLTPDAKLNPQRVLDIVGGDPGITMHTLGRGRVVFFATSADTRWTTLPAKPAFVALIHEILTGTISDDVTWANVLAGSRLEVPRSILEGTTPVLTDPNGKVVPLEPAEASKPEIAFRSEPLSRPGLYRLQIDGRSVPIAVNFPAEASDLTHLDVSAVRKALGDVKMQTAEGELPAAITGAGDQNDFGWPLLLSALVVMLAESFLAMWFRR